MGEVLLRRVIWVLSLVCVLSANDTVAQDTGTLVVVNKRADTVSLINLSTGETVTSLPTGRGPHELAITGDGRTAVVTDYAGGNSLTVIDVASASVVRTIDLSEYPRPHGAMYLPGDTLLAVSSEASQFVVVVDVPRGQVVRAYPTGQPGSHMVAIVGNGRTIYTTNIQPGSISELQLNGNTSPRVFAARPRVEAINVTPDGSEVWFGSNDLGTVNVLVPSSGEVMQVVDGFEWPYRVLFTRDAATVLLTDYTGGKVMFVDRRARSVLGQIAFPEGGPQGMTLSRDGQSVFVTLSRENRLVQLDIATRRVVRSIATGDGPDGIGYSPIVLGR